MVWSFGLALLLSLGMGRIGSAASFLYDKYTEAEVDIWIHNCDDDERQQIGLKFSDGR